VKEAIVLSPSLSARKDGVAGGSQHEIATENQLCDMGSIMSS
jgi:hypothetical protein